MQKPKEELKNQIIKLLEDVFSFGFHYEEELNEFIADHEDYDDWACFEVGEKLICFDIGYKEGYYNGYRYSNYIYIDKLVKLLNCLKEFYK